MIPIAALFAGKGVKVVLVVIAGLVIAWGAYIFLVKPHINPIPTTKQEGEVINNFYNQPRISFGCARWEVRQDGKESKENTTITAPVSN